MLRPAVLVMKSAEDRPRGDVTESLNRTNKRCILTQGLMRPDMVLVSSIYLENLTQVGLAKDDDVIQAFSTDRALPIIRRDGFRRKPVVAGGIWLLTSAQAFISNEAGEP